MFAACARYGLFVANTHGIKRMRCWYNRCGCVCDHLYFTNLISRFCKAFFCGIDQTQIQRAVFFGACLRKRKAKFFCDSRGKIRTKLPPPHTCPFCLNSQNKMVSDRSAKDSMFFSLSFAVFSFISASINFKGAMTSLYSNSPVCTRLSGYTKPSIQKFPSLGCSPLIPAV